MELKNLHEKHFQNKKASSRKNYRMQNKKNGMQNMKIKQRRNMLRVK